MKTTNRWPTDKVLSEARRQAAELARKGTARIQRMLARLLQEAGWTEEDFLDAMVRDVAQHGRKRWQVPTRRPRTLAKARPQEQPHHQPMAHAGGTRGR
jgi:hypothetical protein